ncbi:uncharacterized protein LOC131068309 isoform X2 [Cryptomeria japonica]|uniref:uncharacterized protein LOC131068309 isoform X2 n=1 Tax=Cryptomeria japonica TaxID=3369 RepID=UPI0025AD1B58|nr:uncharacterized protein LOC131068309 isoform X2 [Cryptomeria japonica]
MFLNSYLNTTNPFVPSFLNTNPPKISSLSSFRCIHKTFLQYSKQKSTKCICLYNATPNSDKIKIAPKSLDNKFGLNSGVAWDSLKLLEWPKLCEAVAAFAGTTLGKESLKNQLCSLHISEEQSEGLLSETSAGIELLNYYGSGLDFTGLHTAEIKSAIDRLERGFVMDGKEALAIAALLQFSTGIKNTLKIALEEDAQWYNKFMPLTEMINEIVGNQALVQTILRLVDEEGLLKDDALYGLMSSVLWNGRDESSSQDVSYIDGRWCIRLSVDHPTGFQGLLLRSGSGVEKYVEPVSAVPLNDELAQARALVSKAEHEVLANLTDKVLPLLDQIKLLLSTIVQLDVIISRAKYSLTFGGRKPTLSFVNCNGISHSDESNVENCHGGDGNIADDWLLHLRNVYHPLLLKRHHDSVQNIKKQISAYASKLQRATAHAENISSQENLESHIKSLESKVATLQAGRPIPVDILVRRKTKVAIITGPNTGGKTAVMKTVGLAALMARRGLYVLAAEPVKIPCFDFIFADIGDEQSLSQSLSTFSGHLKQIMRIRAQSTGRSLVLLDEVGAGTNPLEGAALGMSLLESFADSGSLLTVATTHQGELKALKYSNDRFENVSVEYDEEKMRPTYKLLWGIPGRSNAISIAERLGLPTHILDSARKIYGTASAEINKVITDLEGAKQDFQEDLLAAEYYLMQSRLLYQRLMAVNERISEYSSLQQHRKTQEISVAAANARSALHRIVRNFRESEGKISVAAASSAESAKMEVPVESSMDYMSENTNQVPYVGQVLHSPSLGTKVKVLGINESKNEVLVQFGYLKCKLSLSEWRNLEV